MPKVAFTSVGCKLNRYEIQVMSESLQDRGFVTVPFSALADCYVVNTCTVTSDADTSSRQLIRRARRRNPAARVVVTGCYAQLRPDELQELGIDAIVSNREKEKLPELVASLFGQNRDTPTDNSESGQTRFITGMNNLTRAFVKIQDGCDEECTFCTIWMARGPVVSRPADAIVREIKALAQNDYKEVALTGVHIGKYDYERLDLVGLLKTILDETPVNRIRFSSLNPLEIDDDLVRLMSTNPRICPHVHLSIQSGDDDVIRWMGRKYSRQSLLNITGRLRDSVPGITIGADFIVGFPGETDAQFENSCTLLEQADIHYLHVFPYSDRPGTRASAMPRKVPDSIKSERTRRLRQLGQEKKLIHIKSFIGRKLLVLVENRDIPGDAYSTGLSENYLRVNIVGANQFKGKVVKVIPYAVVGDKLTANVNIGTTSGKKELTIPGDTNIICEPLGSDLTP